MLHCHIITFFETSKFIFQLHISTIEITLPLYVPTYYICVTNYHDISVVEIIRFEVQYQYCSKDIISQYCLYNNMYKVRRVLCYHGCCKYKNKHLCQINRFCCNIQTAQDLKGMYWGCS